MRRAFPRMATPVLCGVPTMGGRRPGGLRIPDSRSTIRPAVGHDRLARHHDRDGDLDLASHDDHF